MPQKFGDVVVPDKNADGSPVHRLAFAAGRTVESSGQVPQFAQGPTGLGCPVCLSMSRNLYPINTAPGGSYVCSANPEHKWPDIDSLRLLNPPKMQVAQRISAPPPGSVGFHIHVPQALKDAAEARFGARLPATVAAVIENLLTPGTFIVGGEALAQLAAPTHLGSIPRDAGDLAGRIATIVKDRESARLEARESKSGSSTQGTSQGIVTPGAVTVMLDLAQGLGPEYMAKLRSKALLSGRSMQEIAVSVIQMALDNEWL